MQRTTAVGAATVGAGAVVVLTACHPLHAEHTLPPWLIAIVGLVFIVVGVLLALGDRLPRSLVALLACLYLTLFSVVTAWVGFDPSGHAYAYSLGLPVTFAHAPEAVIVGRWLFGLATAALAVLAVFAWCYWLRRTWTATRAVH